MEYLGDCKGSFFKEAIYLSKKLGIVAEISEEGVIRVKSIRKAGRLLAYLAADFEPWVIRAEYRRGSRKATLRVRSWSYWTPKIGLPSERKPFDSSVEEIVFEALKELGFDVIREPKVIKVGEKYFVPDFGIRLRGSEVLIEVVGYWRPEYLRKKELLSSIRNFIIADESVCNQFERAICY